MTINIQLLSAYVDEIYQTAKSANAKASKLDVKSVMWYIKAWTKVCDVVTDGGSYRKQVCMNYTRKGVPDKTTLTRTKILQRDMGDYQDKIDKQVEQNDSSSAAIGPRTTLFDAADKSVQNLVFDYWQQIALDKLKVNQLSGEIQQWMGLSHDQVMNDKAGKVFAMDRSV
jgi:hypothetical protein